MRAIGQALVAAAIVFAAAAPAHAGLVPVEKFGTWRLLKDSDPVFGDLGYRLDLPSTSDNGASTVSLFCYFDETSHITYRVELSSSLVNFGTGSGQVINSILRYDDGDLRQADWLRSNNASRLGFSSGGNNFVADTDNPAFKQAVREGRAGGGGALGELLANNMTAGGIEMFFWNATVHDQLALGFGSGSDRVSMVFDLTQGATAVNRLLGDCYDAARGTKPEDTRSPRDAAPWRALETVDGQFKTVSLKPADCLELHAVRHRRGDPLIVDDLVGSEYRQTVVDSGNIVIDGPKERLRIYFGQNASAGSFDYRVWERKAATCAAD